MIPKTTRTRLSEWNSDILSVLYQDKIVAQSQDGHKNVVECGDRFIIAESCYLLRRVNRTKITGED